MQCHTPDLQRGGDEVIGVYEIVNLVDGRATAYVGSSIDVRRRWWQHRNKLNKGIHNNNHLQRAWDKYGEAAFEVCVVEEVDNTSQLLEREQFWLGRYLESRGSCYNEVENAGGGSLGLTHSVESRRKISEANKGRKHTAEHRRHHAEAIRGRPLSTEHRRKLSVSTKGRPSHLKGTELAAEHKHKIGESCAKLYPVFRHQETGETIPAGMNLAKMCREQGLCPAGMCRVKNGVYKQWCGWRIA